MQLKFFAALTAALLLHGVAGLPNPEPEAAPVAEAEPVGHRVKPGVSARDPDPESLVARACSYSTGCRSVSGANGQYCGYCDQVVGTYNPTHIYQLNGQSGSSGCCDYGYSTHCADWWNAHHYYIEC